MGCEDDRRRRPKGVSKYVGPGAEEAKTERKAREAARVKEVRKERAAAEPAAWQASLDERAKRARDKDRDLAAKDSAAWRAKLDERARKHNLAWHVKNPGARNRPRWT